MLSVWEILPAQVSLPSLVEVVGLLHNWIRSPSRPTAEWRSSLHVLVCVSVQIWSPGLHFGVLIWVIFWSLFQVPFLGTVLGPYNYKQNPGPQNRAQKWNPKRTKIWPKSGPKMQSGAPNLYGAQTRTCRDDLHSAVGLLGDLIQLCNKPRTSTKEGRETWAGKIAQTKSMNTFADQTYLEGTPNGHHILPPFHPQKLAPFIVTFASTNTPATFIPNQRERDREEGCM